MQLAPVIIFAYNRPLLLQQTLRSLSENEFAGESVLYIFCDGPKPGATNEQRLNIEAVRTLADGINWCRELHVIRAEKNKGLAASIIEGVSQIIQKYGKVIVIEDDVLLSRYFLRFMNEALIKYENENRVLSIGSWNYFVDSSEKNENFFLRFPDSIAWATFKRAWDLFEKDSTVLLDNLREKKLIRIFNGGLNDNYFERMLMDQLEGRIDSWAIRWTATSVIHNMLNFYPGVSLSKHIGFDAEATHESLTHDYNRHLLLSSEALSIQDIPVEESREHIAMWRKFIKREFLFSRSLRGRIFSRLSMLKKKLK